MHTSFMVSPEPPPLAADAQGVLRVGGTRVTFETVIGAYLDGATAEEIAEQYPVLPLAHVYAVIAYYLAHPDLAAAYLREQDAASARVREQNEQLFPADGIRARLLARRRGSGTE
jgi:uncharacterized protein (DUF433 family)